MYDFTNICAQIKNQCQDLNLSLATIESCTAGLISSSLVAIPGSSSFFKGGVCAYANEVKVDLLGVDPNVINKHGAVSSQCAMQMAVQGAKLLKVDLCLSVTGIAGPFSDSSKKKVGTVYFALSCPQEKKPRWFKYHFCHKDRNVIRNKAAWVGLLLLKNYLMG